MTFAFINYVFIILFILVVVNGFSKECTENLTCINATIIFENGKYRSDNCDCEDCNPCTKDLCNINFNETTNDFYCNCIHKPIENCYVINGIKLIHGPIGRCCASETCLECEESTCEKIEGIFFGVETNCINFICPSETKKLVYYYYRYRSLFNRIIPRIIILIILLVSQIFN